jgi:diguanylate cyclase (GGDEF)-like protein
MNSVDLLQQELRYLRQQNEQLVTRVDQLEHDALSGLWRREPWEERAARLLAALPPCGVAVIVLDLDGFKQVNDELGHATGDLLIRRAGSHLGAWTARYAGLAGRLGGDEFVVAAALTTRTLRGALRSLHAALTAPAMHDTPTGSRLLRVGASIGAVHTTDHPHTALSTLMRRADEAMYEAKRAGGGWRIAGLSHLPHATCNGRRAGRSGTTTAAAS